MGPLFQLIFFYFLYYLNSLGLISEYIFGIVRNINVFLFTFNLLPIVPLDGYKMLCLILYSIFPYKMSLRVSIYISIIALLISFIMLSNIYKLILLLLIKETILEIKNIKYKENKFMLERLLNNYNYEISSKYITDTSQMKKNKIHKFYKHGVVYDEKHYLSSFVYRNL